MNALDVLVASRVEKTTETKVPKTAIIVDGRTYMAVDILRKVAAKGTIDPRGMNYLCDKAEEIAHEQEE